jgi:hypothetical protein
MLTCRGIKNVDVNGCGNRVGGAASVVAVVTLISILEEEDAGGTAFFNRDPRVVVNHSLFVIPENEGGRFRGMPQGTN